MRKLATIAGLIGASVAANATIWDVDFVSGLMVGDNEVPAVSTKAQGGELGTGLRYDDGLNKLEINVGYGAFGWALLEGDFSAAHIHEGSATQNGSIVFNLGTMHLALGKRAGFFSGAVNLTEAQESVLFAGNYYINVHSAKFPSGEIRGQLSVVPEPGTWALMGIGIGALLWLRRK